MSTKVYVLLENMDADAPVFQTTVDGQRVKVKKIPVHRPTLRQTFQDENGKGKTIRYKSVAASVDQSVQIKEENIPANEPWTTSERRDLEFKFGVLITSKKSAQDYLEAHPEFFGFKGQCDDIREPRYKLLDKDAEVKTQNDDFRKRTQIANKIISMELQQLKDMLIRLNGSFFETPDDKGECENLLIAFMDDASDAALDEMLKEDVTIDEKMTILIGNAINAKIISFNEVDGQVSKKDGKGKWVNVKAISGDYSPEERIRYFAEFLTTEDGKLLVADIEKELSKIKKG